MTALWFLELQIVYVKDLTALWFLELEIIYKLTM